MKGPLKGTGIEHYGFSKGQFQGWARRLLTHEGPRGVRGEGGGS